MNRYRQFFCCSLADDSFNLENKPDYFTDDDSNSDDDASDAGNFGFHGIKQVYLLSW